MYNKNEENHELPGIWIDHSDRDWAFLVQMLLDGVLDQLDEARIVLPLFEEKNGLGAQLTGADRRLHLIYAKSFVYALDAATQLVLVIQKQKQLPAMADNHCTRFLSQFGELRNLRNSLHHIEDRLRGFGLKDKPIPTSLLVLGCFRNNKYFGATTSDGRYVEIEISDSVLMQAYSIIEDLILSQLCEKSHRIDHACASRFRQSGITDSPPRWNFNNLNIL